MIEIWIKMESTFIKKRTLVTMMCNDEEDGDEFMQYLEVKSCVVPKP